MVYLDYGTWLRKRFPFKVQKLSVDAGFTCPNRDGRIGTGGCIYCNNQSFNPAYCSPEKSVTRQLEEGKTFFARKYPEAASTSWVTSAGKAKSHRWDGCSDCSSGRIGAQMFPVKQWRQSGKT